MSILVAGGAGYIGSHMVKDLIENGEDVVVADNLSTGHRDAINPKAKFYEGDIRDRQFLDKIFDNEDITAVVHFAAFSIVPESMSKPLKYFDNNTGGMITLLEAMHDHDIKYIVFSSTAATYGVPEHMPIKETDPQKPINPYGLSKLMMEEMMEHYQAYSEANEDYERGNYGAEEDMTKSVEGIMENVVGIVKKLSETDSPEVMQIIQKHGKKIMEMKMLRQK